MEIDPFGHKSPESSGDDADDSSSKKKKKSKLPLFTAANDGGDKAEKNSDDKKAEATAEPLWRRILGQPEEEKAEDGEEKLAEADAEAGLEANEHAAPLENLSEAEQLEVAEAYIAARQAELLEEQTNANEGEDEAAVQERVADIALLEAMRHLLARDQPGEQSLEVPVNEAYDTTVRGLGFAETASSASPNETLPPEPETMPPAAAISLRSERTEPVPTYETVSEYSPAPTASKRVETIDNDADNRRRVGSALLAGGLVGYFVGRRRGRIKTEKQFKSVEAKLTKQIENVQKQVVQKEQQIRSLAREAYEGKTVSQVRPMNEKMTAKNETSPVIRTERLGLLTLKAVEAPGREQAKTAPERIEKSAPKKVEALSRPELLAAAAEVSVGATNLKRVFETNLISEHGLRRLLEEHERGGNVRESLERQMIEKEMSYERDPRLRNRSVMGSLAAGKVVRADIDKPTPAVTQVSDDDTTGTPAMSSAGDQVKPSKPQPAAVAAVVTLTVVIAVLLVILFTSR